MVEEGMITSAERDAAEAQPLPFARPQGLQTQAPYFVEHVRRRLEQKYGTSAVWRGGLKIYTTLDMDVERGAEAKMEKALSEFDAKAQARAKRGGPPGC